MYWYLNSLCLSFLRYKMELIIVAITFILVLGNKSVEIFASHDIATSTFKAICHSVFLHIHLLLLFLIFPTLIPWWACFFFFHRLQEDWNKQHICSNFDISKKDFNQLKLTLEYKINDEVFSLPVNKAEFYPFGIKGKRLWWE